jgi:hypothetical protein
MVMAGQFNSWIGSWVEIDGARSGSTVLMTPSAQSSGFGGAVSRCRLARTLLSESSINWAEVTTRSPSFSPARISTRSPDSMPVSTGRASNRPSPRAMITRCSTPVRISASRGIWSVLARGAAWMTTSANMLNLSRSPDWENASRARTARVLGSTSG